jgi:hypothetical protein
MKPSSRRVVFLTCGIVAFATFATSLHAQDDRASAVPAGDVVTRFQVTVDRGADIGQHFGSLFEAQSVDSTITIGAGFQNGYNTRLRADRHAVQFFIRVAGATFDAKAQPLPRPNDICGTYLFSRDDTVYSTYEGLKRWNPQSQRWEDAQTIGGTEESMRVGAGLMEFGDGTVRYDGRTILDKPAVGNYHLFYYVDGYLCFYHIDRREGGYRPYANDADGFSKLIACPWSSDQAKVDLSKAIVLTLPIVGETTFAWGQLGNQIVTGSNVGGFYILEDGKWRQLLKPNLAVSYQLYSSLAFQDRLLMGQYPTGRLFEYDGKTITDRAGWPPLPDNVSASAREAQTTVICGGELFVGVWPWGELWRYDPGQDKWRFQQRMFSHPETSKEIVHPYDVENKGNKVSNQWGQRVTSLVTSGDSLYVSTSAKDPCPWDAEQFPFLANDQWKSYGAVYRIKIPGHLGAPARWTEGPTRFEFVVTKDEMRIIQDGALIGSTKLTPELAATLQGKRLEFRPVRWGEGIYGKFNGKRIEGLNF